MPIRLADFYDAELHRHHAHFRAALEVGRRDRVLDVGCGAGQTTRDVARIAVEGSVVGVDVSEELLQAARRRSAEEGVRNVVFELGDAQVHPYPADPFDLCISRFGVMFFANPVAAFTHIGRAMRPGARLVLMVWQNRERNPWSAAIQRALGQDNAPAASGGAFSLADRAVTARLLDDAGFDSVAFAEVREPVFYGPTVDAAFAAVAGLFDSGKALVGTNAAAKAARQRLDDLLRNHLTADGVLFDSCAWLITARRA
jgi:SAM-dependent methyltransferase